MKNTIEWILASIVFIATFPLIIVVLYLTASFVIGEWLIINESSWIIFRLLFITWLIGGVWSAIENNQH